MACPYFCPTEPLPCSAWPGALRPPLGEPYRGKCCAQPQPVEPSEDCLVDSCNLGYAQGACERFPPNPGPDAVRFSLSGDDGQVIFIAFVLEKNYLPFRCGTLQFDRASELWKGLEDRPVFSAQARAFLDSYMRWRAKNPAERPRKVTRAAAGGS